ncbi:predicted protein [Sclerotinia sclerotiorum 1980 UF-70]|uniref:Uncharacterized protein n=1 Tax=Sclerotinia sclerotiorum (strain ATCC 18683 / 1980 / Ss-1) TaxID=665079 RepID=A7EKI6_SCLS1|nr:predicted protein [Sclerotinia sclerotiorum 1980 UF-70]EDO03352.1 predicted protein [Sclerotinia sclerotiorum 1980 UF-70]
MPSPHTNRRESGPAEGSHNGIFEISAKHGAFLDIHVPVVSCLRLNAHQRRRAVNICLFASFCRQRQSVTHMSAGFNAMKKFSAALQISRHNTIAICNYRLLQRLGLDPSILFTMERWSTRTTPEA